MLTLDDRLEITARLAQLSLAPREELALPAECPRHPGERQYDQDWLVYLTGESGAPQVLAAAVLAQCPEIFYAHLQWSVFVLEARGFGSAGLTATLQRMLREVATTFTPAVRGWLREVLEHGLDVVRQMSATVPPRLLDPSAPRQEAFLLALLSGNRQEALRLVDQALAHGDRWMTICTQLIDHVMDEIGRLWALHQINVAQEHMATAVAQMAFSQLSFRIGPAPGFRARGPAVVTGLHNERHQFGAFILADTLESIGWEARFLGSGAPLQDVVRLLDMLRPRLLCICTTLPTSLFSLLEMIRAIRAHTALRSMTILTGGQALRLCPALALEMGADGAATSLQQGLDLLEEWKL